MLNHTLPDAAAAQPTAAQPAAAQPAAAEPAAARTAAASEPATAAAVDPEARAVVPQADIDAFVASYLEKRATAVAEGEGTRAAPPELNPEAGSSHGGNVAGAPIIVGADRGNHWRRRSARWLRAHVLLASADNTHRVAAQTILDDLVEYTLNQDAADFAAETVESRRIISDSALDTRAQHRLTTMLDLYGEDLTALRAVPTENRRALSPLAGPNERNARTHSTLSDAAGGYLVPQPFLTELFVFVEEYGYARRIMRGVPMASKTLDFKDIATKPTAAWADENGFVTESDMAFGAGGMEAVKLAAITTFTSEVDEDSMVALLPTYTMLMGEAIALKEDDAAIRGDATSTYGGQRGILDLSGAGESTVTTMSSGNTSETDFDLEFATTVVQSISKARRKNAKWLLNEATVKALMLLKRNAEANNYIMLDAANPIGIARLLGYPLVDPEGVDDILFPTDAVSTIFGAFGDFTRSLFGQRRGITLTTSREGVLSTAAGVVTYNALQQDGIIAKITERVAIGHPQPDAYALIKTAAS